MSEVREIISFLFSNVIDDDRHEVCIRHPTSSDQTSSILNNRKESHKSKKKLNIKTINISVNFVPVCMQNEKNEEKIKK